MHTQYHLSYESITTLSGYTSHLSALSGEAMGGGAMSHQHLELSLPKPKLSLPSSSSSSSYSSSASNLKLPVSSGCCCCCCHSANNNSIKMELVKGKEEEKPSGCLYNHHHVFESAPSQLEVEDAVASLNK